MRTVRSAFAALLAGVLAIFAVPAYAASERMEISEDHTDGFYIETGTGKPVIKVANGIRGDLYDPNKVVFVIDDSTYGTDYEFPAFDRSGSEGYFTSSWDADHYFEPGWSAPDFEENGFTSVRVEFLGATGPAPFTMFGNDPLGEDESATAPYLANNAYYVERGAVLPITGHAHAHWYFELPGDYTMTVQAVAVRANGEEVRSEPVTEAFRVERHADDTRPDVPPTDLGPAAPAPEPEPQPEPAPSDGADEPTTDEPAADDKPAAGDEPGTAVTPEEPAPAEKPAPTEKPADQKVFDHGHVDLFNVSAKDGKLSLAAKFDTAGKPLLAPESFALKIGESAYLNLPKHLAEKLAPAGYFLSENGEKQQTMPFPGWDTSSVAPEFGPIDIEFASVEGPGRVFMFSTPPFKGAVSPLTSSEFELTSGSAIHQATPSHVHTSWLFEKPGVYTMKVKASGTPVAGGEKVESNLGTYTFIVGDPAQQDGEAQTDAQPQPQPEAQAEAPAKTEDPQQQAEAPKQQPSATKSSSGATQAPARAAGASQAPKLAAQKCEFVETSDKLVVTPQIKDDRQVPAKWTAAESVAFALGDAAKATTNQTTGSIAADTDVWMISSTQVSGVPWLGLNTQHDSILEQAQGATTISLTSFSGPGTMEVFTSGNFGQAVGTHWFTGNGSIASGSATLDYNTHVHPNWVFTKAGTYKVGITMSVTLKSGEKVSGDTVLTFNVGSSSGATDGHFDLGPTLTKEGSWQTPDGKPCTPESAGGSGSLASTGSTGTAGLVAVALAAIMGGAFALTMRGRMQRSARTEA